MASDPLADLGLGDLTSKSVPAKAKTEVKKSKASTKDVPAVQVTHEEVDVGDIEVGTIDYIPVAKRAATGSKYPFDKLAAPTKDSKTGKVAYGQFVVRLQAGVEADKLKRSVQSATTQANRQGAGEGKYFISRSVSKDGEFVGMQVIRTDQRPTE